MIIATGSRAARRATRVSNEASNDGGGASRPRASNVARSQPERVTREHGGVDRRVGRLQPRPHERVAGGVDSLVQWCAHQWVTVLRGEMRRGGVDQLRDVAVECG